MEKILVTLHVPSLSTEYEVLIPGFLSVVDTLELLKEVVEDMSQHRYTPSVWTILCCNEQNLCIDLSRSISECSVQHGDHMYLI